MPKKPFIEVSLAVEKDFWAFLTSVFPPPPQEITAEGRKWKRVSQAGYD